MASNTLQIDDDYCRNIGQYFVKEGEEIEKFIDEYICILEKIKRKAITKGEVSNALNIYISYVKKIKGQVNGISETAKAQIERFISAIDEADQYLF